MKYLILLRHADAKNSHRYNDDFDRPLSERGGSQCLETGRDISGLIEENSFHSPDIILSSSSVRTAETVEIISDFIKTQLKGRWTPELTLDNNLYLPSVEEILVSLWGSAGSAGSVLVCSHNPGISMLAEALFGGDISPFSTAGWAAGCFDVESWTEINKTNSKLIGKN